MKPKRVLVAAVVLALVACTSGPPVPDWQTDAKSALDRAVAAYLAGDTRAAKAESERVRAAVARTGRLDLLARTELVLCAAQVASLVFDPCDRFEALRADAAGPERVYADYLAGRVAPAAIGQLPAAQRSVAAKAGNDAAATAALKDIDDPFSRLVGAGVLLRAERGNPALIALAIETASAQGWRRPLLAWLGLQVGRAESAGDRAAVEKLRRRIEVIEQGVPGR